MKNLFIKLNIEEAIANPSVFFADQELVDIAKKYGLNVGLGDDLGKLLAYWDIEGFRYLFYIILDSKNGKKQRDKRVTQEEIDDTLEYLESKGFEVVEKVPFELLENSQELGAI